MDEVLGDDVALTIDCDRCTLQHTAACRGCLVSFVLDRAPGDAVIIDADEARALRVLPTQVSSPPLGSRALPDPAHTAACVRRHRHT